MADDLQNYKLQLQQVEAALQTDPDNGELLKLKKDLDEVIELTRDLIKTQLEEQKKSSYVEQKTINHHANASRTAIGGGGGGGGSGSRFSSSGSSNVRSGSQSPENNSEYYDEIEAALFAAEKLVQTEKNWKIGDKCQAKWTEDGIYYDATIEGITESGEVSVIFEAYQNRSTTTLKELKDRVNRTEVFPSSAKRHRPNNKEYLKKKKQRKQQRFKELEEEREQDKNKWINFTSKTTKKSGATTKIKSIFASPENVHGRVGIGTCGVSGRPMTEYSYGEKYRKGI